MTPVPAPARGALPLRHGGDGQSGMEGEHDELCAVVGAELELARLTWVFDVAGLMTSRSAMSALLRPSATSPTTSRSRGVSSSSRTELGS